jgi:hypothetical protein
MYSNFVDGFIPHERAVGPLPMEVSFISLIVEASDTHKLMGTEEVMLVD